MSFEQWFYTLPLRWRHRLRGKQVDQELRDELRDHLEQQTQVNLENGMPLEDARHAALLALGGTTQIEQQCRDARGHNFIANTIQDLRYGFRQLFRSPGSSILTILCLTLDGMLPVPIPLASCEIDPFRLRARECNLV